MTQEFVTLPREVVEQALEAMTAAMGAGPYKHRCSDAAEALRAAFEQPQNHVPDVGNMVQSGWNLVPVEPTEEMLRAGCGSESPAMFRESLRRETDGQKTVEMVEKIIQRNLNSYRAMLAAAPQPQTTEQSSAVQQPQGEQEPVATLHCTEECYVYARATDAGKRIRFEQPIDLYTHPQPKREPLTHYEIHELFRRSWDDCQDGDEIKAFARAIEAAHGIK